MDFRIIINEVMKVADLVIEHSAQSDIYKGEFRPKHLNSFQPSDYIRLYIPNNDVDFPRVLFHELVHATGTPDRLARDGIVNACGWMLLERYAVEELIAEQGAMKLLEHFKLDNPVSIGNGHMYLSMWSERLAVVPDVSKQVNDAVVFILDNWLKEFNVIRREDLLIEKIKEFMKFS